MSSEATFLKELKKSFLDHGASWFKIPDMPHVPGATKFDIKKPFDAIAAYKGRSYAIEAKFLKEYKSFGLKDLRPNQIEGLESFWRNGFESYVMLNVRRPHNMLTGSKRCNRLLLFPWREFRSREKNYFKEELISRVQWDSGNGGYPIIGDFLTEIGPLGLSK